jgi:plasmid maintenance system antidote protein VapI
VTAMQIQRLLDRSGISQRGAAKALEINERTMRKYCAGDAPIPRTVEYAIQWVCSQSITKGDLK